MKLADAYVLIKSDDSDLGKGFRKAEKDTKSWVGKLGKGVAGGVSNVLKAGAIAGVAAFAATGAIAAKVISMGSDVEEMLGKFTVVFGESAREVADWATDWGQSIGRSKFELMEMASTLQDTFVPMGFARDEASKLSISMTELAVDVASFNNAQDADVMMDFQSAIVGNHETVRKYGIVMTQTTLDQELYNMGVAGGVKAATEAEKVQARLNVIMAGTTDAQGDAARTAGSWANQMRGLKATITDTASELGHKLLPVMTPLLERFRGLVQRILPELAAAFGGAVKAVAIAGRLIFDEIGAWIPKSEGWGQNLGQTFADGIASAIPYIVAVIRVIGDVLTRLMAPGSPPAFLPDIDKWGLGAMQAYLDGMTTADFSVLDNVAGAIETFLRSTAPEGDGSLIERIIGSRQVIAEIIEQVRETGEVTEEMWQRVLDASGPLPESIENYIGALLELEAATAAVELAQEEFAAAMELVAEAEGDLTEIQDLSTMSIEEARAAVANLSEELQPLAEAYIESMEAIAAADELVIAAQERLAEANAAVSAAQEELNRVTGEYAVLLDPLQAELQALKDREQEIRDTEKLADLQAILADEKATEAEKEKARIEIRKIELRAQMRAIEEERRAAIEAEQAKIDAARGAVETEQERLEAARAAAALAREEAEEARQAAIAAAQTEVDQAQAVADAVGERLAALRAVVTAAQENLGVQQAIIREQQKQIGLLREQEGAVGALGGAVGAAVSGAATALTGGVTTAIEDLVSGVAGSLEGLFDTDYEISFDTEAILLKAEELRTKWMNTLFPESDGEGEGGQTFTDRLSELMTRMFSIAFDAAKTAFKTEWDTFWDEFYSKDEENWQEHYTSLEEKQKAHALGHQALEKESGGDLKLLWDTWFGKDEEGFEAHNKNLRTAGEAHQTEQKETLGEYFEGLIESTFGEDGWLPAIAKGWLEHWDDLGIALSNFWEGGGEQEGVVNFFPRVWGEIRETFTTAFEGMVTDAKTFGGNIMNALKNGIGNIKLPVPKFSIDIIEKMVLGFLVKLPALRLRVGMESLRDLAPDLFKAVALAQGGIVTRPTMALMGEAGPEAVLPLEKLGAMFEQMARQIVAGVNQTNNRNYYMDVHYRNYESEGRLRETIRALEMI